MHSYQPAAALTLTAAALTLVLHAMHRCCARWVPEGRKGSGGDAVDPVACQRLSHGKQLAAGCAVDMQVATASCKEDGARRSSCREHV
ncbi:hypothetical protein V8C86DRAFT_2532228 [Haematococcus lacustris]